MKTAGGPAAASGVPGKNPASGSSPEVSGQPEQKAASAAPEKDAVSPRPEKKPAPEPPEQKATPAAPEQKPASPQPEESPAPAAPEKSAAPAPPEEKATPDRPASSEEKATPEPSAEKDSGPPEKKDSEEPEIEVLDPVSAPDAEGRPRRATRRFPLFTRDTARPEGGGRAAPGDAPAPARQWPLLAVLITVGLGLLVTALDAFRVGLLLIGAGLLGGAALRWLLPRVGMLAVRSRFTDIVTYGVLGVAIVLLALMAQPKPWLEIPFLDDALHFTVRNS